MAGKSITVSVLADTKKFTNSMRKLGDETGLTKLTSGFKKFGKAVGVAMVAGGVAMTAFAVKATGVASNLEQSIGGVDAVFKGQSKTIHTWAKAAATDLGLSQNSYNEFATVVGSQLKNMGVSQDEITGKTSDLIKKGADLAATFGGTTSDAVSALSALMRGEADPIERYGVSIKDADIKARMLADGTNKLEGAQGKAARTQAILALLNEQTADAQGAFARESNTLAGQIERLKAKFENVSAAIGTYFLPAATKVVEWISNQIQPAFETLTTWVQSQVVPAFQRLGAWFKDHQPTLQAFADQVADLVERGFTKAVEIGKQVVDFMRNLVTWVKENHAWLGPLVAALVAMVAAFMAVSKVIAIIEALKLAMAAAKVAALAFNAALLANPIGLIVAAVAALVAGLAYFFTQTETGKAIWEKTWTAIQAGFQAFMDWVRPILDDLASAWAVVWNGIQLVWAAIGPPIMAAISVAFEIMKNNIATVMDVVWGIIQTVWAQIQNVIKTVMGVIKGIIKTITSLIKGDWEGAWQGIKQVFTSIANGILTFGKNAFTGLANTLLSIFNGILSNISSIVNGIKNFITNGFTSAKDGAVNLFTAMKNGVIERANGMLQFVRDIPTKIKNVFTSAPSMLLGAGRKVIQGFLDGISAGFNKVKNKLRDLTNLLPSWKGPADRDKTILVNSGQLVLEGFQRGLENQYGKIRKSLGNFTTTLAQPIKNTRLTPTLGMPAIATGRGTSPTAGGVHITVNAGVGDPIAIAREIKRLLAEYDRLNGGR